MYRGGFAIFAYDLTASQSQGMDPYSMPMAKSGMFLIKMQSIKIFIFKIHLLKLFSF